MKTIQELNELIQDQHQEVIWIQNTIVGHLKSGVGENNPTVLQLRGMKEKAEKRIEKYQLMIEELVSKSIGRPSLGVTKKVSITLPEEVWTFLDEKVKETESNRSAVLRDILINAYEGDISWFKRVFGQVGAQ